MAGSLSSTLLRVSFQGPLLQPNSRRKGTLIIKGLLRNQVLGLGFRMQGFRVQGFRGLEWAWG